MNVRVQANGGKFLGPALAATPPKLTVSVNGMKPYVDVPFPTCSSGAVVPNPDGRGSPYPIIVTSPPPGTPYEKHTNYLVPPSDANVDPVLRVLLELPGPTDVDFTVTACAPQPVVKTTTVTLPGPKDIVLLVPGLRITNVTIFPLEDGKHAVVTANVAMMCGCAITPDHPHPTPKEPYWPAYEFEVFAQVGSVRTSLSCTGTSLFQGEVQATPGQQVTISAKQLSIPENYNTWPPDSPPCD